MPDEGPFQRLLRRSGGLDALRWGRDEYNQLRRSESYEPPTDLQAFREVQEHSRELTDISDHLERLFIEALQTFPDTIVELGVRGGESTFVFERVACLTNADVVSVDIDETSYLSEYDRWNFVQSDDIAFADEFDEWCDDNDVAPAIDVLFIDTSHRHGHTAAEIEKWFPHLAEEAVVLFHDTNIQRVYRREDGTVGLSPLRGRGVVRAIEEHFGCTFEESEAFVTVADEFVIEQYPLCSGLAVLRKLGSNIET